MLKTCKTSGWEWTCQTLSSNALLWHCEKDNSFLRCQCGGQLQSWTSPSNFKLDLRDWAACQVEQTSCQVVTLWLQVGQTNSCKLYHCKQIASQCHLATLAKFRTQMSPMTWWERKAVRDVRSWYTESNLWYVKFHQQIQLICLGHAKVPRYGADFRVWGVIWLVFFIWVIFSFLFLFECFLIFLLLFPFFLLLFLFAPLAWAGSFAFGNPWGVLQVPMMQLFIYQTICHKPTKATVKPHQKLSVCQ